MSPAVSSGDGLDEPDKAPPGAPLCAFSSPRQRLLGIGTAAIIDLPAPWPRNVEVVPERLRALASASSDATVPVAFGALPYDTNQAGRLIVPTTLWIHTSDGERTRIDVADTSGLDHGSPAEQPRSPREVTVRSVMDSQLWCDSVLTARERIRSGGLDKVVLAREIEVRADEAIDPAGLWNRLVTAHPGAFCYAIDGFVGASPELLVSRNATTVRARPMAGTTRRSGVPEVDQQAAAELLASDKNRWEHQITIDSVHDALLGWCSYLDAEPAPSVVAAGPVQHLATMVEGRLSRPEPDVLELVAALHPTPAVGGFPRAEALALQRELEPRSRGRYAGPVGWIDASGNGTFAVGIRGIELDGANGRMFAGVGVVADSDPHDELAETRAKAKALLSEIIRI